MAMVQALAAKALPSVWTNYGKAKTPHAFSQQPLTILWGVFFILMMNLITNLMKVFNKILEYYMTFRVR
jgi:hypothetical protein